MNFFYQKTYPYQKTYVGTINFFSENLSLRSVPRAMLWEAILGGRAKAGPRVSPARKSRRQLLCHPILSAMSMFVSFPPSHPPCGRLCIPSHVDLAPSVRCEGAKGGGVARRRRRRGTLFLGQKSWACESSASLLHGGARGLASGGRVPLHLSARVRVTLLL